MAFTVHYVYEPQLARRGWPDDSGLALPAWFDKDLAEPTGAPPFFQNVNILYAPLIQYQVFPPFWPNANLFFAPRAFMVGLPSVILKNERRRIKILRRKPPS